MLCSLPEVDFCDAIEAIVSPATASNNELHIAVLVPPNKGPGDMIPVDDPNGSGRIYRAKVPKGVKPGRCFLVPRSELKNSKDDISVDGTIMAQAELITSEVITPESSAPESKGNDSLIFVHVPPGATPGTDMKVPVPGEDRVVTAQIPAGVSSFYVTYRPREAKEEPVAAPSGKKLIKVPIPRGTNPGTTIHVQVPDEPGRILAVETPANRKEFYVTYDPKSNSVGKQGMKDSNMWDGVGGGTSVAGGMSVAGMSVRGGGMRVGPGLPDGTGMPRDNNARVNMAMDGDMRASMPMVSSMRGDMPMVGSMRGNMPMVGSMRDDMPMVGSTRGDMPMVGSMRGDMPMVGSMRGNMPMVGSMRGDMLMGGSMGVGMPMARDFSGLSESMNIQSMRNTGSRLNQPVGGVGVATPYRSGSGVAGQQGVGQHLLDSGSVLFSI